MIGGINGNNLLLFMSDEHNRNYLGCYGSANAQTPNLDQLARSGVTFNNAYCNSPICVPSRASMATGLYAHEIGAWDNAAPYTGTVPSWGHVVSKERVHVTTIGKLHYRSAQDNTGFYDQRIPMHVKNGIGDIYGLIRTNAPVRQAARARILSAGCGETDYTRYDRNVAQSAIQWLMEEAGKVGEPWVLMVSFVSPHFPLVAPHRFWEMYEKADINMPMAYSCETRPRHPVLEEWRRVFDVADELPLQVVRNAIRAYLGLCSFLDSLIGEVLEALNASGLAKRTRVIYTSDHGDSMGEHGLWWKHSMYEGSVAVPLLMSGEDVPVGQRVDNCVSLVDLFPTIVESVGVSNRKQVNNRRGISLFETIREDQSGRVRTIFAEYHAAGMERGVFMVRRGPVKLIKYVGFPSQLFDLDRDPYELSDLSEDHEYDSQQMMLESELENICDIGEIDRRARKDQERRIEEFGGRNSIVSGTWELNFTPAPDIE